MEDLSTCIHFSSLFGFHINKSAKIVKINSQPKMDVSIFTDETSRK